MKVIEQRKRYYALSILVIAIGVIFMVINMVNGKGAFNKDIKFAGGSRIQIDVNQPYSDAIKEDVLQIAKEVTGKDGITVASSGETGVVITMTEAEASVRSTLFEKIKEKYNLTNEALLADETVSPSISKDIKTGAVKAVLVGTVLILIYISLRFKDYRFGASAVVALIHDVLIMLAAYAVFRIPLNNSFIAAMLTIVGYSINDTIVVFDRIRENRAKAGIKSHVPVSMELVDSSINQTIGRSLSTSFTTIIIVILLFVLGTDDVREFAFPLIIGVAAGTYSSIFIASPLWYDLTHTKKSQQVPPKKAKQTK